ncbi:RagB/SusD family nutrient uptake outer membrane protein [Sphingobacterium oryzagri]|uniref:RagB/SusD family nutrient uptake outer membrane protein n=1 Tax=Sphingobacterium oryzagri TaxID=3025669 RepID=A0ABY7WLL0_9SPHI|nr:RagB/SusD family nutrient uptake outer membrane protein [Sphingobacterium sp. KACC 22765]WDF69326.1 RagB/SusD family nutrient uptake outer membrane protein [Sphingobacterium sp. KACC 22765]
MNTIYKWRNISVTFFMALALFCMISCEKGLLDTLPRTQVLTANMWNTDNLTDQGVNGVYQALKLGQTLYKYDQYVTLQPRDNQVLLNGTATSSSGIFSSEWQSLYEGVHTANNAIWGITNVSPSAVEKKQRYLAEVKFLRAFFYYRLNQLYKGVPIYLEPIAWDNVLHSRNTEQEVWDQILTDLNECIAEATLPDRYNAGNANYGRVTKSAAYALRGKVYMYLQRWQDAITDFQAVQNLGHTLFPNYANLFKGSNEQSPEVIFSIQNMALVGYGSDYQFVFGSRSAFGSNWNTILVHPDAVDRYENIDGTAFRWESIFPGYNNMSAAQREVFFLRDNLTAAERASATNRGADMSRYLPVGNEARLQQAFVNRDPRLASNVILPFSTFIGNNAGVDQRFTMRWPYRAEFGTTFDLRTDIPAKFFYLPRKFVYEGANPGIPDRSNGAYDYIVIRFADILLLWAEALNELPGRTSEAIAKVNEVRARAGVATLAVSSDQVATRQRIRDERRRELICEGVIFFDEMRWKTWKETSFYTRNGIKEVFGRLDAPYSWVGDHLYTWPIPRTEIQRNPNLQQNEGWID